MMQIKVIGKRILEIRNTDYPIYRIPGMVITPGGTMLVYYECRQGGDWSVIDICMRKSTDGGATWSSRILLAGGGGKNTVNNPVMFADDNLLHFIWFENYKRAFYRCSTDDGERWSATHEITDVFERFRRQHPWTVIAAGPGHGTVTSDGRLVVPVWIANDPSLITAHSPSICTVLYSTNHGQSWKLGEPVPASASVVNPNEAALAELSTGSIMLNIRNQSDCFMRCVAISQTGTDEWSEIHFDENLMDPHCEGAMCGYPGGILFTNCRSREARINLSIMDSHDDGRTWREQLIDPVGAYSDVFYHPLTKTAFVVYEQGDCDYIQIAELEL